MLILENKSISEDIVKQIVNKIKEHFDNEDFDFEDTVQGIQFWCDNDKEKTVFIQTEDECYATVNKQNFENIDIQDIVTGIKGQLDATGED